MDKDILYFALNVLNDLCLDCRYTNEINDECPIFSGKNIQRLHRVTGYLPGNYKTVFKLENNRKQKWDLNILLYWEDISNKYN